ncbi:MAG: flagellar basal body rod protein FlgB [bacterium]|nr:flagellar basal body rod protein FlgB [bacterium]
MDLKDVLFNRTPLPTLNRGLDASALRQKAIADNIANAQTPGYKRKLVTFESRLSKAMEGSEGELLRTQPEHLRKTSNAGKIHPQMEIADDRIHGPGSEELNMEREMADLAQTQLQYEAEAKLAYRHFDLLKMAIRGSR